jgi:hypothetical protein
MPDLCRVDALEPDALFVGPDGVAVDHDQSRSDCGKGRDHRVYPHNG